jgi:hypothetical protein
MGPLRVQLSCRLEGLAGFTGFTGISLPEKIKPKSGRFLCGGLRLRFRRGLGGQIIDIDIAKIDGMITSSSQIDFSPIMESFLFFES